MGLDVYTKITLMLGQLHIINCELKDDGIRPTRRERLEEDKRILKEELREIYFDLYRIIRN